MALLDSGNCNIDAMTSLCKMFPDKMITFHMTNVCDKDDLERAFKEVSYNFQSIDCVVTCAGVLNENDYKLTIEVNLVCVFLWRLILHFNLFINIFFFVFELFHRQLGVIHTNNIALKYMSKETGHNGGLIVNISSVAGIDCTQFSTPVYNASKHGVVAFTRSMGVSYVKNYL